MAKGGSSTESNPAGGGGANPFARRTVLLMVLIGFAAFLALLYALGAGGALRSTKNGAAHGASQSLVGYAALADLLRRTGSEVHFGRSDNHVRPEQGLLILTPDPSADPKTIAEIVSARQDVGPTLIILPKWQTKPLSPLKPDFVRLVAPTTSYIGARLLSGITPVTIRQSGPATDTNAASATPRGGAQRQADMQKAMLKVRYTISGDALRAIIVDGQRHTEVALLKDGGWYPALDRLAPDNPDPARGYQQGRYPVVIVADADLFNNYGLANRANARLAVRLIDTMMTGGSAQIVFDLTQNGLGSRPNLLSLAFRPPFLSMVLCLVLMAIALIWIGFFRFGPPLADHRAIAFGKQALVANSAGLIRRLRRDSAIANAYADLIRERAARALGLPPTMSHAEIDARLAQLDAGAYPSLEAEIRRARSRPEIVRLARALYDWKRDRIG